MHSRSILALSALILFLASIWWGHDLRRPKIRTDKQTEMVTFQADIIRLFSFGMKRAIADLIWVQTLTESDLEHYREKDLNSWLYLRFLTILSIDPKFYENYRYGGQYLMIVKDDLLGADDIMKRGVSVYPTDYYLNWQLGYLHAIELNDPPASFPYFERIKDHPLRPRFFDSFYTKIVAQKFGLEEAYQVALELWKNTLDNPSSKRRLSIYLYSLKALIDLDCLNRKLSNCDTLDFEKNPYLRNPDGSWRAYSPVLPIKLNPNKK